MTAPTTTTEATDWRTQPTSMADFVWAVRATPAEKKRAAAETVLRFREQATSEREDALLLWASQWLTELAEQDEAEDEDGGDWETYN